MHAFNKCFSTGCKIKYFLGIRQIFLAKSCIFNAMYHKYVRNMHFCLSFISGFLVLTTNRSLFCTKILQDYLSMSNNSKRLRLASANCGSKRLFIYIKVVEVLVCPKALDIKLTSSWCL